MLRFKSFYSDYLTEASGKKIADVGMAHEDMVTHSFAHMLRTASSQKEWKERIPRAIFGTKSDKGGSARGRVSKIRKSKKHPLKKALTKLGENIFRPLYRDSTHTAAALAHHFLHNYGAPISVEHVGAKTAGVHNLVDEEGNPIKTNADVIVKAKNGTEFKLLGNGLKYSQSESGGGSTKIYSPTHNTMARVIDGARKSAGLSNYNGHERGLQGVLEDTIDRHRSKERKVYTDHDKFLQSTFIENPPPRVVNEKGKPKPAPTYTPSQEQRPLNDSALSHVRKMVKAKHPEATAFYNALQESNKVLQNDIGHHMHTAASEVLTNIGNNGTKRKAAANLYRSLNNAGSSIRTIVCSTVKKLGMSRPDVHIYNHNESVEDYIKHVNENGSDYNVSRTPNTGSFKIGKISFGVDSRPGESNIMVNGKIQNSEFRHEASYTNSPESIFGKKGKTGKIFSWDSLRTKK